MSTLRQINEEQLKESSSKAYRMYQCSGDISKSIKKYLHYHKNRVHLRLIRIDPLGVML